MLLTVAVYYVVGKRSKQPISDQRGLFIPKSDSKEMKLAFQVNLKSTPDIRCYALGWEWKACPSNLATISPLTACMFVVATHHSNRLAKSSICKKNISG
jgi:hypothetical protein